ncbi:MAG TPA: hypothetical protein PKM71_08145 [Candidatus Cloacimonas sp.]|nr:hypothetical protein [Candidatus Cloacimonas sp.]
MKKFILPLLLILTVGMLAAVESEPSAMVGYVKYDCIVGLNLLALPMDQGYGLASDIGLQYTGITDAISYFDPITQDWSTAVDLGGFWDNDFTVGNGSVLLMYAYSPFSFYSIGNMYANNASYNFLTGLNTAMVPLNRIDIASASQVGMEIGSDAVSYFDASAQDWSTAVDLGGFWDNEFSLTIASPFLVYSYSDMTWPATAAKRSNIRSSK